MYYCRAWEYTVRDMTGSAPEVNPISSNSIIFRSIYVNANKFGVKQTGGTPLSEYAIRIGCHARIVSKIMG